MFYTERNTLHQSALNMDAGPSSQTPTILVQGIRTMDVNHRNNTLCYVSTHVNCIVYTLSMNINT